MATYAIGDVQGCFRTLEALLRRIAYEPNADTLWFAGDLINRGPDSLQTLRFVSSLEPRARVVLGNHDLHLLGRVAGVRRAGKRDTLDEVLAAPDLDSLVDWLRRQPLAVHEEGWLMVHAGLLPEWTVDEVLRRSAGVQARLRSDDWQDFLRGLWSHADDRGERHESASVMTLLRILDADLRPAFSFNQGLADLPPGHMPWFQAPNRQTKSVRVLFGHWAALGHRRWDRVIALDSGCVWGGQLTAFRLEDGAVFQIENQET